MIPNSPFSLKKLPVQCSEKSSSTFESKPYRVFSYLEKRPLQFCEMSFSRENLTLPYSAQQSAPCTKIFSELFLARWGFLSLRDQSPYLDKRRQNSSPKFDDLLPLRKRPSYLGNLPVQCTEVPSSKEASTSFSDQSLKLVNPPVECTEISSLKEAFASLRTQRSHLDKLPIQCSEISSLTDDFLLLSGRTTYCDKFPVQCTEMSSPADDIPSTSILPSYLVKFPIQCTEISLPTEDKRSLRG